MPDAMDPNKQPGAKVVIEDDGSVTAHGRNAWIWCTDAVSGARLDYPARRLPKEGLEPVPGYEVNFTPFARDSKSSTNLAGEPPAATRTPRSRRGAANSEETTQ